MTARLLQSAAGGRRQRMLFGCRNAGMSGSPIGDSAHPPSWTSRLAAAGRAACASIRVFDSPGRSPVLSLASLPACAAAPGPLQSAAAECTPWADGSCRLPCRPCRMPWQPRWRLSGRGTRSSRRSCRPGRLASQRRAWLPRLRSTAGAAAWCLDRPGLAASSRGSPTRSAASLKSPREYAVLPIGTAAGQAAARQRALEPPAGGLRRW